MKKNVILKTQIYLNKTFNKEGRQCLAIYSADCTLFFYSLGIDNIREGDPVFQGISVMFRVGTF